jgi:hypothetical protein
VLKRLALVGIIILSLNGCGLMAGAVVGAAMSPIIQPAVDRVLDQMGLDWFDPAGTSAVKPTPPPATP